MKNLYKTKNEMTKKSRQDIYRTLPKQNKIFYFYKYIFNSPAIKNIN